MPNLFDQLNGMLQPPEQDPLGQQVYDSLNNTESAYARASLPTQPAANFSKVMAGEGPLANDAFSEASGPAYPEGSIDEASPVELPRHIDQALQYLLYREGFKSKPYPDGSKHSIGFGTQVHPVTGKPVRPGDPPIDKDEGQMGVIAKLSELDGRLMGPGFDNLNPGQRAAVLSFMFNVGENNFMQSTLAERLKEGDAVEAEKEFDKWVYADGKKMGGLKARRDEEQAIFKGKPWNNLQRAIEEGLSKKIYVPEHRLPSSTYGKRG